MAKRNYVFIEESKEIQRFELVTNEDGQEEIWERIAVYDDREEAINDFVELGMKSITSDYVKEKMNRRFNK